MKNNKLNSMLMLGLLNVTVSNAMALSPSQPIKIETLKVAGTGCPVGSVTSDVSSDKQAFTVLFDSYIVQAGPGVSITEGRKFCQILLDLKIPQGWQYSVFKAGYTGFADLDAGTSGTHSSTFYFQGDLTNNVTMSTELKGPLTKDYMIFDEVGIESMVWSKCGESRALNLKTSIRVKATGSKSAIMTMDSVDGEIKHIYGIRWRRC